MEITKERALLEMLDNPEAYSEQEIADIINHDEDTRELYRLMEKAKRSSRQHQMAEIVDVDAAWERFSPKLAPMPQHLGWLKVAASFAGILLISGIALAAIHIVQHREAAEPVRQERVSVVQQTSIPADTLQTDTSAVQPVVYDNVPLEKMLAEIAAYYRLELSFLTDEDRQLRFHFVWKPEAGIEHTIEKLNRFESLNVRLERNKIIVE